MPNRLGEKNVVGFPEESNPRGARTRIRFPTTWKPLIELV